MGDVTDFCTVPFATQMQKAKILDCLLGENCMQNFNDYNVCAFKDGTFLVLMHLLLKGTRYQQSSQKLHKAHENFYISEIYGLPR